MIFTVFSNRPLGISASTSTFNVTNVNILRCKVTKISYKFTLRSFVNFDPVADPI